MNFFHHKDLGNHLLQLYPKVVKHPVYILRHCATSRKVAGSFPIGSFDIFINLILPATLAEMSSRDIFWAVKAAGV